MRILPRGRRARWLAVVLLALAAPPLLLALAARFSDGPIGPFPGGALSGERAAGSPDWSRVGATVVFQLAGDPPRSVRTYAFLQDDALYVPSFWAPRKLWPERVLEDPRILVRVDGRLHPRRAVRIADPARLGALRRAFARRHGYDLDGIPSDPDTWYFRLDPAESRGAASGGDPGGGV